MSAFIDHDEMRAAFEAWVSEDGKYPRAIARNSEGFYILVSSYAAWNAFSLGWTSHAATVKESSTVEQQRTDQ